MNWEMNLKMKKKKLKGSKQKEQEEEGKRTKTNAIKRNQEEKAGEEGEEREGTGEL